MPVSVSESLFRSSTARIEDEWIDYNGHLNVAYYVVLFDRFVDEAFAAFGVSPDFLRAQDRSLFAAEMHVRYLSELSRGARTWATVRLLDVDAKRLRIYLELYEAETNVLSATSEQLYLHVDIGARRVVGFASEVLARLKGVCDEHAPGPIPEWIGRGVAMRRK